MTNETPDDLFLHTLKAVLYAERTILKVLPRMERRRPIPNSIRRSRITLSPAYSRNAGFGALQEDDLG